MKSLCLFSVLVVLSSGCAAEKPVANASITEAWQCQVSGMDGSYFKVDVCGNAGDTVFIVYSEFDQETFERNVAVATGVSSEIVEIMQLESTEASEVSVALYPAEVLHTEGGWEQHDFNITVKNRDGNDQTFFFTPSGQPDIVGRQLIIKELPSKAKSLIPEGAQEGYYGTLPTQEEFLIYSVQHPSKEPQDEIEEMMNQIYPSLQEMHVLIGRGLQLEEVEVKDSYSYGGGMHVYIETSRGMFLFGGRGQHEPIFGQRGYRYYVE